jgi:hypothetical protein
MLTKQDLMDQREQIQNDLQCVLDGLDESTVDAACQVVVDRFIVLETKQGGNSALAEQLNNLHCIVQELETSGVELPMGTYEGIYNTLEEAREAFTP